MVAVGMPIASIPYSGHPDNIGDSEPRQMTLFPDYFDFHGPEQELKKLKDLDAVVAFTADKIGRIVEAEGCLYSEIAVICTLENPDPVRESLPISLKTAFSSRGILSMWASESYRSKQTYDITTNSVTVSTIHSMKGFDFSCVLLIGLDFLEPRGWAEEQINNLVYVGMARARYQLYILYIRINLLIKELSDCSFFR
jgi:superfamily I DNA/RNA helicase